MIGPRSILERLVLEWAGRRDRRRELSDLAGVLEHVARELRAGRNLHGALEVAAAARPHAVSLRAGLRRARAGEALLVSIDRWAAGLAHPDGDLVRAVLGFGASTGGSLGPALDRAADTLRERDAHRRDIRVLGTQARISAVVLSLAPLGFVLLVSTIDPGGAAVLVTTGLGRACLVLGLALDGAGFLWMRHLVAGVQR
ncbi:MAG: hypothetical protein GWN79_24265 [Actinobacteria bacterium]|nr:hypothetical protein [Actinomycetota bacterium]NIS35808.1 hypothetical protein [Actinomycetota bacterium]NIT98358.1 hypothetical protein [Actinomycetota bacterium]NIU21973.1 hypothetical protein [Actinomycetota bacterium]NIU70438.1 hypothetical protein [Actinomycetota bacterium]